MSNNKIRLVSIAGPTASGKTALSVEIAMRFGGEIVSADSMQIYKNMDIATAKPTEEEKCGVPHHLMDFVSPDDVYSVARYVKDATRAVSDIYARGRLPVIVGGTGLYIDSLLGGIEFCEGEVDFELRAKLFSELQEKGLDYMLSKLKSVDSESASRLALERNPKRIIRALEVFYTTGITMTEQNKLSQLNGTTYEPVKIALNFRNRDILYDRINRRVDVMVDMGLIDEAKEYFASRLSSTSKQAIGYKELKPYFDGDKTLNECLDSLKQATRRYAKRQLTWFRRDESIRWFFVDDYISSQELIDDVCDYLISKGFELI